MKEPIFSRHTSTLLQYIGIGLISGAISHGFFSGTRSLITASIGIVVFIGGILLERLYEKHAQNLGKVLVASVIFSIAVGMVSGGFQHFLDSPWRSAWIIPVGYVVSLVIFTIKEETKTPLKKVALWGSIITAGLFALTYPIASIIPASTDHHALTKSESDTLSPEEAMMRDHCAHMPEMAGCEKYIPQKNDDHHDSHTSHADHSAMVTSEGAFVVNMIPHHQEAVDTARLVVARGRHPEVKKLAQAIIDAQEREIVMMKNWVNQYGYRETPHYELMMGDGTQLSGEKLDQWFLAGMIAHHEGAVQMAESVLSLSPAPRAEVIQFAQEVIRAQSKEIEVMRKL